MGGRQILWRSIRHLSTTAARHMSGPIYEGVLAINKPAAISSAQVIRDVQNHFNPSDLFKPWLERERAKVEAESHNQRTKRRWKGRKLRDVKMGHGGTLDPMATGVLILGVGAGTKELGHFTTECTKSYETVVLFGAATDTYDTEGKVVSRKPFEHITREKVAEALEQFKGKGMQKPPIFSALRVQGKRLYEYAREGKPLPDGFEIQERPVEVSELELLEWYPGGTHTWHWPKTEADNAEKKLAEQALNLDGQGSTEAANPGTDSPSAKRKREDDETEQANGAAAASPSPKRTRGDGGNSSSTSTSDAMPATIKRLSTQEGAQPDTEVAQPPKDDQQPASSSAEAALEVPQPAVEPAEPPCAAPACRIRMTVTSGFYVRSLCHDLGAKLSSLGMMTSLVRTRQSDFELGTNVLQYEELKQGEDVWGPKVRKLLEDWKQKKETKA